MSGNTDCGGAKFCILNTDTYVGKIMKNFLFAKKSPKVDFLRELVIWQHTRAAQRGLGCVSYNKYVMLCLLGLECILLTEMHYSPSKHTITVTSDVSYNVQFKIDQMSFSPKIMITWFLLLLSHMIVMKIMVSDIQVSEHIYILLFWQHKG